MQLPNPKTPVPRCVDLAAYSARMLGKFKDNAVLTALSAKMSSAGEALAAAQAAYGAAAKALIPARVDVKFADLMADLGVVAGQRAAETADGVKNGPIASRLYPAGTTPITKPVGDSQVKEMHVLESRYDGMAASWSSAGAEKAKIVALRQAYEEALNGRRDAAKNAANLRATRNIVKEDFLDLYAEVANRVKAEFPRNKKMQDLFFDDVSKSPTSSDDDDGEGDASPGDGDQ
jgi:hypothetical protein